MKIRDLEARDLQARLAGPGLTVHTGPFATRLHSTIESVAEGIGLLYAGHPVADSDSYADFSVEIAPGRGLHRFIRPQARFLFDGTPVFEPMPQDHAYPLMEWAMNWCVSSYAHQYLILHAAVLARGEQALVMPAPPGSGKSTLCAALTHAGWRLLSDELTLIAPADGWIQPLCRPVSLKNQSIEVIRGFAPQAVFNRVSHGTAKGSVSHMRVPDAHLAQIGQRARMAWLVFPRYQAGAQTQWRARSRAASVVELARNAFNYTLHGEAGFDLLVEQVRSSACLEMVYSRLDEAMRDFDRLAAGQDLAGA